jgi:hypothetical protein
MATTVFSPRAVVVTRWAPLHAAEDSVAANPVPRTNHRSTRTVDSAAQPPSRRASLRVSMSEVVARS